MKLKKGTAVMIVVYAPEEAKRDESVVFCEMLQQVFKKFSTADQIILVIAIT